MSEHTPPVLVTHRAALDAAIKNLRTAPRVAVDTESNSMHAYTERLCILQLAVAPPDAPARETYIVDVLSVGDLRPLETVLGAGGPTVIFHDVGYDARMLYTVGIRLGTVLDTALHARLLGMRETGLAALLSARFGIHLSKSMQQHDWSRRPLDARAMDYLAGDVARLGELAAWLESEAITRDITEEIAEETRWVLSESEAAMARTEDRPLWARVRGMRALKATDRAVLRELALVRDAWARRMDLPAGRLISAAQMVALASARPRTEADLLQITGQTGPSRQIANDILAAIARADGQDDVPVEERRWTTAESPRDVHARHRLRERALSAWRAAEATRRGVDPQVVLPGHALAALAAMPTVDEASLAAVSDLGHSRRQRYAHDLVAVLRAVE